TQRAKAHLVREGKDADRMAVTGNAAVDAVIVNRERARLPAGLPASGLVAVTVHRRANRPVLRGLAGALGAVARAHPELSFVYPAHRTPAVREAVWPALDSGPNVRLLDPVDYLSMVALIDRSVLVVTDSGGI